MASGDLGHFLQNSYTQSVWKRPSNGRRHGLKICPVGAKLSFMYIPMPELAHNEAEIKETL